MRASSNAILATGLVLSMTACSDDGPVSSRDAAPVVEGQQKIAQRSTAPFACGVEYTVVATLQDDVLASYGMATLTDTSRVCGTWTGSDYRVHVEQLGSSEPPSETSDPLKTAMFSDGVASGTEVSGAPISDASYVASTAFDLGQATANEVQASYNDPYYGVYGGGGGGGGGGDTCISGCDMMLRADADTADAPGNPRAKEVKRKDHGIKRTATRALVGDKDEIEKGSNGHRRFKSVDGEIETIIEVEPSTELVSAQETRTKRGVTRARLQWNKRNTGYVRDLMVIDAVETDGNGTVNKSRATVRILDLTVGGQRP
jgi:hypothetical protein